MSTPIDLPAARAQFAAKAVDTWSSNDRKAVKGLPVLIRNSGLGQAVAFLAADKSGLADALAAWLLNRHSALPWRGVGVTDLLRNMASETDLARLRYAEQEAVEIAVVLKLYSGALHG